CYMPEYRVEDITFDDKAVVLVLDGIEIPGNMGTLVRVADGAGADAVFIVNRKARLTHPKFIHSTMGAAFHVPIIEFESVDECFDYLRSKQFTVYLADSRAEKMYYELPFGKRVAFVMGSERYGISRVWYDKDVDLVAIPMLGECDSLNVGVAGTVLLYEACVKNKLGGRK
ncbi:MAG: RNA methyltransferase, partial [Clostridia bacterium]|nr:RNA methyltransferase [Clostridia bacterium]